MEMIRMNGAGNSFFVLEDPEGELRRRGPGALARQLCRPEEGEQTGGGQESGGSSIGGGTGNITPGGGDPDPDDNGGDSN